MPSARPARYAADTWAGGFTIDPEYVAAISAATGTVVAATERLYLLRPGATRFQCRDLPEGAGDAMCVAVEPRRPGSQGRFAVATIDSLHIYEREGVASVKFPEDHGEVLQLLWAPRLHDADPTFVLYLRFADFMLQLAPEGGRFGTFLQLGGLIERADAMATDDTGIAFACFDEDSWELTIWFLADPKTTDWYHRNLEAPDFYTGATLAMAGGSIALSFNDGGVWMTRDIREHAFTEVESLRGRLGTGEGGGGAPIVFEGAARDAALLAAVRDSRTTQHIVRVDAEGRAARVAEVETDGSDAQLSPAPPLRAMAWDSTRRTLWSAAGRAGILASTAAGAPWPLGAKAAS